MDWLGLGNLLLGGWGMLESKKAAKDAKNQSQPLIDEQLKMLKALGPIGQELLGYGRGANPLIDRMQQMGMGQGPAIDQYLAPLVNQMTQQQAGAVSAQRSQYPRGGQTASQTAQLPYQLQGNIANMKFQTMGDMLTRALQARQNQTSQGLAAMGQGAGLTNSMLDYGLNARAQQFNQGMAAGQGMTNSLLMAYMMRNQGAPRTDNNPTPYTLPAQNPYTSYGDFTPGKGSNATTGTLGGQPTASTTSYNPYQAAGRG